MSQRAVQGCPRLITPPHPEALRPDSRDSFRSPVTCALRCPDPAGLGDHTLKHALVGEIHPDQFVTAWGKPAIEPPRAPEPIEPQPTHVSLSRTPSSREEAGSHRAWAAPLTMGPHRSVSNAVQESPKSTLMHHGPQERVLHPLE